MKIGFTGTQHGMTRTQAIVVLDETDALYPTEAHHGLCVGADEEWHDLVSSWHERAVTHGHPPMVRLKRSARVCDVMHRPKPYIDRNHDIVDATERLIAAPQFMFEEQRSGTWATIRYARSLRRPLAICWPDGTVTRENWPDTPSTPSAE